MSSGSNPLRALGAALLNATLLLAAIVLALGVTLVVQLRGLAADMRGSASLAAAQVSEAREQAAEALATLERAPPTAETGEAREALRAALDRLAQVQPDAPDEQVDGIMRQLVLAIFATAASAILDSR